MSPCTQPRPDTPGFPGPARLNSNKNDLDNSIFYAKRIQEALLPERMILSHTFKESFLLFKPKDTLSGDFYWYARLGNKFIFAVADCTGHGIPGAMVSVLGYTVLDDIVKSGGVTDPGHILRRLDKAVRKLFKQGREGYGINDGMDIAICTIDFEKKKIGFAGANRPLAYVRDKKLLVYRGNKNGIGGTQNYDTIAFDTVYIPYVKGDSIYLFTDGYSDQFGGGQNKKLMRKDFFSCLESLSQLPMQEQGEQLEMIHQEWKGVNDQTDDILFMGIKLN